MSIVLSKSFSPSTISEGETTQLIFTVVINEIFPQPVIQIFETLPSGIAYAGSNSVPSGWIVFQVPPTGSTGVIQVDGISLPNGTYILTFDVTNVSGQTNTSCDSNPPAFTNDSSNLILLPPVFTFDGVPSCLIVNGTTPSPKKKKKNRGVLGPFSFPNILCVNKDYMGKYYPNSCQDGTVIYYYRVPYIFSHKNGRGDCCFKKIYQRR